jgi:hypothetical protein
MGVHHVTITFCLLIALLLRLNMFWSSITSASPPLLLLLKYACCSLPREGNEPIFPFCSVLLVSGTLYDSSMYGCSLTIWLIVEANQASASCYTMYQPNNLHTKKLLFIFSGLLAYSLVRKFSSTCDHGRLSLHFFTSLFSFQVDVQIFSKNDNMK